MSLLTFPIIFCDSNSSCHCVFSPNAGKYGPEKTPYLDTFHTVLDFYAL